MHPYCPALPGMKAIANFTYIPNMGVALLSCTIKTGLTLLSARTLLPSEPWKGALASKPDHVHIPAGRSSSSLLLVGGGVKLPQKQF